MCYAVVQQGYHTTAECRIPLRRRNKMLYLFEEAVWAWTFICNDFRR